MKAFLLLLRRATVPAVVVVTGCLATALVVTACAGCDGGPTRPLARLPEAGPAPRVPPPTAASPGGATAPAPPDPGGVGVADVAGGAGATAAGRDTGADPGADERAGAGTRTWTGTTEPHRRSTLTPRVPSTVVKVHVRDGDRVRAGDPLVTFDTEDFGLRLRQAEAALEGAKVQVDATRLEWERARALLADKAIPQSQFDMVDARLRGAQAAVNAAQVAVDMGRKALRDAVIRAPYDGVVVRRHVNEGEYAAAMPPTPLVTLEETGVIDLRLQLPATERGKVARGDRMRVRFPALGKELEAEVARIVPADDPRTRTFSVVLEIPHPDGTLGSGVFAQAWRAGPGKGAAAGGEGGAVQ